MLFLFVFMGMIGGYCAARLFRTFKGNRWKSTPPPLLLPLCVAYPPASAGGGQRG